MRPTRQLYTRMTLFLPCRTPEENLAVFETLKYLEGEKGNKTAPVKGFTYSRYDDPVFFGAWFKRKWFLDIHVLLIIDYELIPGSEEIQDALRRLNKEVLDRYTKNNSKQKALWITTHGVSLYAEVEE